MQKLKTSVHRHRRRTVTFRYLPCGKVEWCVSGFRGGSGTSPDLSSAQDDVDVTIDIAEEAED